MGLFILDGKGNFDQGFIVSLKNYSGDLPSLGAMEDGGGGELPPAPDLPLLYKAWQIAYRDYLGIRAYNPNDNAAFIKERPVETNVSGEYEKWKNQKEQAYHACTQAEKELLKRFHEWLNSGDFGKVKSELEKYLFQSGDKANRILIESNDKDFQKMPWQKWDLLTPFSLSEVGLSSPNFKKRYVPVKPKERARVLVILGEDANIQQEIQQLATANIEIKVVTTLAELDEPLWNESWDIIIFNGHSGTSEKGTQGKFQLSQDQWLSISDIRNHLNKAIDQGLKLVIFNSCDGLGLAHQLGEGQQLYLPQIMVMRDLLPVPLAPIFLQRFFKEFIKGISLYSALRATRDRLKIYEQEFPCASWLPVICQNPAENPVTWQGLIYHSACNRMILTAKTIGNKVYCVFSDSAKIGYSKNCEFVITDKNKNKVVSKLHAIIEYKADTNEYWIEDFDSTNGTYVNEIKLSPHQPQKLENGSEVKLGYLSKLKFEQDMTSCSCGVLIEYNSQGIEANRYIVAPKDEALIGTSPNDTIRFPKIKDGLPLGKIVRKADGFYWMDTSQKQLLLEHGKKIALDKLEITVELDMVEDITTRTTNPEDVNDGHANQHISPVIYSGKELKPPSGEELPPYIGKLNLVLIVAFLGIQTIVNFHPLFKPNANQITQQWMDECIEAIKDPKSSYWKKEKANFPPNTSIRGVFTQSLKQDSNKDYFLNKSGLSTVIDNSESTYLERNEFNQRFSDLRINYPNQSWIGIEKVNEMGTLSLRINYWNLQFNSRDDIPAFEWKKSRFLYWHSVFVLFFTGLLCRITRDFLVDRYRNKVSKEYDEYKDKRGQEIYNLNQEIQAALKLAKFGEPAKAISQINNLLKNMLPTHPVYASIVEAKRKINSMVASQATKQQVEATGGNSHTLKPNSAVSKLLYLRILGTPYAYQAPDGLERISIGRQRRKNGSEGNDVCIRVPGADSKSLRISRFHLRLERIGDEYFVFTLQEEGGRTSLNGKILDSEKPYPLKSGDTLLIAGVLTLEVLFQVKITGNKTDKLITINHQNCPGLEIEASIGDMITECDDYDNN